MEMGIGEMRWGKDRGRENGRENWMGEGNLWEELET